MGREICDPNPNHGDCVVKFIEASLSGAWLIELEKKKDHRGFFARTFCDQEFAQHGLETGIVQSNLSFNAQRGTLRGMHFQYAPKAEAKLVRCCSGSIYDVILDLREDSSTFGKWECFELTAVNRRALYVPEGFAHGFQTLSDNVEVLYQMFERFHPECAGGVLWNDSAFGIDWPISDPIISEKDNSYLPYSGFRL